MSKTPSGTDWLRQRAAQAQRAVPVAPTCNNEDALDSVVERFLQLHGVKYAPKAMIPIGLIDEKSSLQNQARDVPIIPESVDRFAASLRKGEYLPPIIVFPNGSRVTIVDGNNRHGGHKKAGSREIPGFVISAETPSETIQLLTVAANNGHGVTPDLKWRKRQAAHLAALGFTSDKACEAAGISKSQLGDFLALQRADARAKAERLPQTWFDLPETTRLTVGRVALDSVFKRAAKCVLDTAMDSREASNLTRDIKAKPSEDEQLAVIAEISKARELEAREAEINGKSNRVSSAKQSFITGMGKIMHVDPLELARQTLTEHDRRVMVQRANAVGEHLLEIIIALEANATEGLRDAG